MEVLALSWISITNIVFAPVWPVQGEERLEAGVDDVVGLQGGDEHVEHPEEDEQTGGKGLDRLK